MLGIRNEERIEFKKLEKNISPPEFQLIQLENREQLQVANRSFANKARLLATYLTTLSSHTYTKTKRRIHTTGYK